MNIKSIKPKQRGISDKFSWQLYYYIKKHHKNAKSLLDIKVYYNLSEKVYDENYENYEIKHNEFDKNNLIRSNIHIGDMRKEKYEEGYLTWYYGNKLNGIIGTSKEKYTKFANPWWSKNKVIDITEWFWSEYLKLGRCLFTPHDSWYKDYNNTRWTYINKNSRRCNWCGQYQRRFIETEKITMRNEVWREEVVAN